MSTEGRDVRSMTQFGVFYPRGYIVAAFAGREDAARGRRDRITGDYDEADCELLESEEVENASKENLSRRRRKARRFFSSTRPAIWIRSAR